MQHMAKVRVEWESPPDSWIMPAAVVFNHAVQESSASYRGNDEGQLVVHVSVFLERHRPSCCHGEELLPVPGTHVELLANPMVHLVHRAPVVQTKWGDALIKRKLVGRVLSLLAVLAVIGGLLDPWHTLVPVPGKPPYRRSNPFTKITISMLMLSATLLVGHITSKQLLKMCFQSFFSLLICLYTCLSEALILYERFEVLHLTAWSILPEVLNSISYIMVYSVMGLSDAVHLGVRAKLMITLNLMIFSAYLYFTSSVGLYVPHANLWGIHIDLRAAHASAITNQLTSSMRFVLSYVAGYKYAVLQPVYIDPHWGGVWSHMSSMRQFLSDSWQARDIAPIGKASADDILNTVSDGDDFRCSDDETHLQPATCLDYDMRPAADYQFGGADDAEP